MLVRVGAGIAAVLALAVFAFRAGDDEARVRIEPSAGLFDAPLRFEIDGVQGASRIRLTLSATSYDGVRWTATRTVTADGSGAVSIDGGTLFASLLPTGSNVRRDVALIPRDGELRLGLEASEADRVIGTARATRSMKAEGVSNRELALARDDLVGRFWPGLEGHTRPVAVLLLGGSEGGMELRPTEPLLASHGYPVLRRAYFRARGLPAALSNIPLEYFVRALEWLRSETSARRVVVIGASRGAELALILGSRFPELVDGVVAYAPSSVVNPGYSSPASAAWTYGGKPIPTIRPAEYGFAEPSNRAAIIPVERIRGPVMTVAGVVDMLWPAASYAVAIERRRATFNKDTLTLVFQGAGHGVVAAIPYLPLAIRDVDFAETRKADALARTATWPRVLALLERVSKAE